MELDRDDAEFQLGRGALPAKDLLLWEFASTEESRAAVDQLKQDRDFTTARLGRVVLASQQARELDDPPFDEDIDLLRIGEVMQEHTFNREREARSDVRLKRFESARQRAFLGSAPSLLITFETSELAEALVSQLKLRAPIMSDFYPIVPWTPGKQLTDTQQQLQDLLIDVFYQSPAPWMDPISENEDATDELDSDIDWEQRDREAKEKRDRWFSGQVETSQGVRKAFLKNYQSYLADVDAFNAMSSDDNTQTDERPRFPEIAEYIKDQLPAMGYLTMQDRVSRFSGSVSALVNRGLTHKPGESDPEPLQRQVRLTPDLGPDSGAMLSGLIAWLKNTAGVERIEIEYTLIVLPEDAEVQ